MQSNLSADQIEAQARRVQGKQDATREGCPRMPQDPDYMAGWREGVAEVEEWNEDHSIEVVYRD